MFCEVEEAVVVEAEGEGFGGTGERRRGVLAAGGPAGSEANSAVICRDFARSTQDSAARLRGRGRGRRRGPGRRARARRGGGRGGGEAGEGLARAAWRAAVRRP